MPDRTRRLAESLLALFAGAARAGAIYGDLVELAQSRGRGWFWAAYARTMVALTWRIVLALFVADVARELVFAAFHLSLRYEPAGWRGAGGPWLNLSSAGPAMACVVSTMWFALPFAAVRYGTRDRMVRLAVVIALATTVGFWMLPWVSAIFFAAAVAVGVAALLSEEWRRAALVLVGTGAAGLLTLFATMGLGEELRRMVAAHSVRAIVYSVKLMAFQGSLLSVALVCSRLHARLLGRPASGA